MVTMTISNRLRNAPSTRYRSMELPIQSWELPIEIILERLLNSTSFMQWPFAETSSHERSSQKGKPGTKFNLILHTSARSPFAMSSSIKDFP
jgi:hypothetical protein